MVANPQQYMHQTIHTINKKSDSRLTVKEGRDAKSLDATQNWSICNTNEFVSTYVDGMISFQWSRCGLYMSFIISNRIWRVVLIIRDGNTPAGKGENDGHPRFRRVRVVKLIEGNNVMICDCGYFQQDGLSCIHIFQVNGDICLTGCDTRWCKSYNYRFGWIPRYTQKMSQIINRVKEVDVPFVASPPTITAPVYTNCTDSFYFRWVMKAPSPAMMDECFPERLNNDSDDEFDYYCIDDGDMVGEYAFLFTPQQLTTEYAAAIQLATTPQTINHPYHFHLEAYK
jgi:hypothetical protein